MIITKIGHCCLVIEENGLRILTDPGSYSTGQSDVRDLDVILITHEHADHLHIPSLRAILKNNPKALVLTNRGVAAILDAEKISYTVLEDGESTVEREVTIAGHGKKHALIYPGWKEVVNTGYFIANKFFYPGDAFLDPKIPVEVLALPVAGPWMKISEAIDYALIIKPKIAFPVHDGMLKPIAKTHHLVPGKILAEHEIEFRAMNAGDRTSF